MQTYVINTSENRNFDSNLLFSLARYEQIQWISCSLNKIKACAEEIFEKEDKSKDLLDMLDKIDEMKKSILARAFRGELGTSNPSDELAIDLLRKILEKK